MFRDQIEAAAIHSPPTATIDIYFRRNFPSGERVFAVLEFKQVEDLASMPGPSVRLSPESAVGLMDSLWAAGVRPTQIGTAGHVQAQAEHIEDLRMVVKELLPHFARTSIKLEPRD